MQEPTSTDLPRIFAPAVFCRGPRNTHYWYIATCPNCGKSHAFPAGHLHPYGDGERERMRFDKRNHPHFVDSGCGVQIAILEPLSIEDRNFILRRTVFPGISDKDPALLLPQQPASPTGA